MRILSYLIILLLIASPVYAVTNSTITCYDNSTMEENITVYKDSNASTYSVYTTCSSGCNNNTIVSLTGSLCNPDEMTQYIVLFLVLIGLFILYNKVVRK